MFMMNFILPKPTIALAGVHTFTHYSPKSLQDQKLIDELEKYVKDGISFKFADKCKHLISKITKQKNLTTDTGREFLAQVLCNTFAGTNAYVTHFAIGDSNTAATTSDIALGNELFRSAVSSGADDNNTANISTFIGASDANFTWEEWGHFIDATGTVNSGVMLSHHIEQQTKAAPNTVTVDSVYTLTDV